MTACVAAAWSPGIGDPSAWGWITVLAYLGAAGLCALAARGRAGRERLFWAVLAGLLGLLALNKQLDLQSALTAIAKCEAQAAGWYEDRGAVQRAFVLGVAGLAASLALAGAFWMRRSLRAIWPALLGLTILLAFVAARAASFHRIDALLPTRWLGVSFNAAWEVGALGLIAWGAFAARRRRRL